MWHSPAPQSRTDSAGFASGLPVRIAGDSLSGPDSILQ